MDWRTPVDLYCERTGPGFWAEPLNALTNGAFLLAAGDIWRRLDHDAGRDLRLLTALIAMVGIGSFVFHTVAERWASLLDVSFIAMFVLAFIHRALRRLHGWSHHMAGSAVVVTIGASAALAMTVQLPALNGSELYLGPWGALIALALSCPQADAARWLRRAAVLFMLSMLLRSVDMSICDRLPVGTHFLWHLNNAGVLWCGMRALLCSAR